MKVEVDTDDIVRELLKQVRIINILGIYESKMECDELYGFMSTGSIVMGIDMSYEVDRDYIISITVNSERYDTPERGAIRMSEYNNF